jgi:hypothetical protein
MDQEKIGNGSLPLPVRGNKVLRVWGGPYTTKPKGMFGVKMAKEIRHDEVTVDIPTPDYKTPPVPLLNQGVIDAVDALLHGEPIYVGCMAGRGRTGLFLAILAKTFGIENPVEYVRENYYPHAVETNEQYAFVMNYQPPAEVHAALKKFRSPWNWKTWFKTELTRQP